MIADIQTVVWKEWREVLAQRFGAWGNSLSFLIIIALFGVVFTLDIGKDWDTSPMLWVLSGWIAFTMTANVVADAFAGERERRTLETLLATRLSDKAIFIGKVCAAAGYGNSVVWLILCIRLITINVTRQGGPLVFYNAPILLGGIAFGILGAGLAASIGALISLHAPTVRQAQQLLTLSATLLPFIFGYGSRILPLDWRTALFQSIAQFNLTQVGVVAGAIMLLLNIAINAWAISHFKRSRLILKH